MTIHVIEGRKDEIVDKIARLTGQVTRAIVWTEDSVPKTRDPADVNAIMAELDQDTVSVGFVDDSREALYTRMDDE